MDTPSSSSHRQLPVGPWTEMAWAWAVVCLSASRRSHVQNDTFCLVGCVRLGQTELRAVKPDAPRSSASLLPFLSLFLDAPRHVCIMVMLDKACWTRCWSALVLQSARLPTCVARCDASAGGCFNSAGRLPTRSLASAVLTVLHMGCVSMSWLFCWLCCAQLDGCTRPVKTTRAEVRRTQQQTRCLFAAQS